MRDKKVSGFSLVELLVVIAVMGILSSVAWLSFSSSMERGKIRDATLQTNSFFKSVVSMMKLNSDVNLKYSLKINTSSLALYDTTGCAGNIKDSLNLEDDVVYRVNSLNSAPGTSFGGTSWMSGSACVEFAQAVGKNTISTNGFLIIGSSKSDFSDEELVYKVSASNRFKKARNYGNGGWESF